ncbi:MAG: hypothetical protein ACP5UB_03495 [Candidatus Sumerlaeaceae bacterium]
MSGRDDNAKARAPCSTSLFFEWGASALGIAVGCIVPLWPGRVLSTASLPGAPRSDFEYYFFPLRCHLARVWGSGIIPFWNPHLFCGYPVIESVQSAVLYPFNALGLNVPAAEAIVYLTAAHLVLNYLTWWLALRKGFGFSCATSSVTAALANVSALLPYRFFAGHLTIIFAFPWIPLLGAAAYQLVRQRSFVLRWWGWAVVCSSLVITAGAPQFALFAFYGAIVLATAKAICGKSAYHLSGAVGALFLGGLLALPQIAATLDYIPFSARQGSWTAPYDSAGFCAAVLETLLPAPLGDGVTEMHMNERGVWDTAGYFGAIALVAGFLEAGCFFKRGLAKSDPRAFAALMLLCFAIYIMSGGYLPGFSGIRESQRALVLLHFSALLFVALFLDSMRKLSRTRLLRRRIWGYYFAIFLSAVAALIVFQQLSAAQFSPILSWIVHRCLGQLTFSSRELPDTATYLFLTFQRSLNWVVGWLALAALATTVSLYRPQTGWLILAILMLLDPLLLHYDAYQCRTRMRDMGYPLGLENTLASVAEQRKKQRLPPPRFVFPTSHTNIAQCTDGVYDAGGYDPLMPALALARRGWITGSVSFEARQHATFAALGVCGVLDEPKHQPEFVPPPQRLITLRHVPCANGAAELVTEVGLQPRSYLFGPVDGTTHTVESDQLLIEIRRWLRKSDLATAQNLSTSSVRGKVRWYQTPNPNHIWLSCFSEVPQLLVVHTTWLPGWRATVESGRGVRFQKLLRCNGWMIGCPVPAGYSFVKLDYAPRSWHLSVFLSLTVLTAVIVFVGGRTSARTRAVNARTTSTPRA